MATPVCPLCRGFGKVHPTRADGRVDYSTAVFCACQGERAFRVAHPRVPHPDFAPKSLYDSHDRQRQARYRGSPAFRRELAEVFGVGDDAWENPPVSLLRQAPSTPLRTSQDRLFFKGGGDREKDLAPLKAELCYLRNKLNEHLDYARKRREARL